MDAKKTSVKSSSLNYFAHSSLRILARDPMIDHRENLHTRLQTLELAASLGTTRSASSCPWKKRLIRADCAGAVRARYEKPRMFVCPVCSVDKTPRKCGGARGCRTPNVACRGVAACGGAAASGARMACRALTVCRGPACVRERGIEIQGQRDRET